MPVEQRFNGRILSNANLQTTFGGQDAHERIGKLRHILRDLRARWPDNSKYKELLETLKAYVDKTDPPEHVRLRLQDILNSSHDYADTAYQRPLQAHAERYDTLQLYCDADGYDYIFRLQSEVLRAKEPSMDLILTAATFLEFLTIDLYNLRLSHIGDEMFRNFQGVTYRGLSVGKEDVDLYDEIFRRTELEERSFGIPLGLMSSSTERTVMESFSIDESKKNKRLKECRLHMTIHVHGIDSDLLAMYLRSYPNSVVTTICAMPVARLSKFGEKEILLRGPFFHIIDMACEREQDPQVYSLVVVMISANRDHTTESSSNEGAKDVQRRVFTDCIKASRYEVCANLAKPYSMADAQGYETLQRKYIDDLEKLHFKAKINTNLASARSTTKATWLGATMSSAYPQTYCNDRQGFRTAILRSNWGDAVEILHKEYTWRHNDWLSIRDLKSDSHEHDDPRPGYTALHIIASSTLLESPSQQDADAWRELQAMISAPGVWKTLHTLCEKQQTALELARGHGRSDLQDLMQPTIRHLLAERVLHSLEQQLHSLVRDKAANLVEQHTFTMPPLSILTEMEQPELWIPIPHMHGGFNVELVDDALDVTIYETIPGKTQPHITRPPRITANTMAGAAP